MEQLEFRNLLATFDNTLTWTTFEDHTGNGATADDTAIPLGVVRITDHFDATVGPRQDQELVGGGVYSATLVREEPNPDTGLCEGRCDLESFDWLWEPAAEWRLTATEQVGENCFDIRTRHTPEHLISSIGLPAFDAQEDRYENVTCEINLYSFKPGTISGEVFNDHNGNGVKDAEDIEPIEGISVFLDEIPDGSFSAAQGEPSATTDAAGKFTIQLTHATPQGALLGIAEPITGSPSKIYTQTTTSEPIVPLSGFTMPGQNVGVFKRTSISGTTFVDHNGNGVKDSEDEIRPSTVVFVDANGNGILDNSSITGMGDGNESFAVSDGDGKYKLTGLTFGDRVRGRSPGIPAERFSVTHRNENGYVIANDVPVTDADVGIFRNVSVFGLVYEDVNGDGVQGDHHVERELGSRIIELDLNNNGTVDRTLTTLPNGIYQFFDVGPGTHKIHLVRSSNETQTQPANAADRFVTPQSDVGVGPLNFGLRIGSDVSISQATRNLIGNRIEFDFATAAHAGPFQVSLFRSADELLDTGDTVVGSPIQITPSAATGTEHAVFNLPVGFRTDPAVDKLIIVIDPQNAIDEVDESNNAQVVQFTSDIALGTVIRENTGGANTSQIVTANYQLTGNLPTFELGLYRSADQQFDASDVLLGERRQVIPEAGSTSGGEMFNVGLYQPDSEKPFLLAVVDPQNLLDESNEGNNAARVARVIELAPMHAVGNFEYNEAADRFEAHGDIEIGLKPLSTEIFFPLVKVSGTVTYDVTNIQTSGTNFAVIKHVPVEFFVGSARINVANRSVNQINVTSHLFDLGGLKLDPSLIAFVNPDGGATSDSVLEVQGSVVIHQDTGVFANVDNLPPFGVTIEEPNKLKLGPKAFELSGRILFPPHMSFRLFGGISAEVDDLSAEFLPARNALRIRGKMTFPELAKSFLPNGKVAVEITGEENFIELTPTRFDFVGALTVEDLVFAGTKEQPLFGIKEGKLSYSTLTNEFRGEAEIILPGVKTTLLGGFGVRQGEINFLSLGLDHLNVATPWLGLFLQKIQGQVDGLANPNQGTLELAGTLGFTYGPETTIRVPQAIAETFEIDPSIESAVLRFETTGKLSSRPSVTGSVKIQIVHKDIITALGDVTVDFKDQNLQFKGTGSVLKELLSGSFSMTATPLNISGTAAGKLKIPNVPAFGPGRNVELGNANAFFAVSFDGDARNDFIVAYGVIDLRLFGRKTIGVRATLAGNTEYFFSLIEVPPRPGGAGEGDTGSSRFQTFTIEPETQELMLTASWETENPNVPIEIIAPDGTVFTESTFDPARMAKIEQLSSNTDWAMGVLEPAPGIWTIRLPNTDDLGAVTLNAYHESVAPEVDVTSVTVNATSAQIAYEAIDPDSAAQIRFFYDTDNSGADGMLIGEPVTESDGAGTASWDLRDVPANSYYVYAMIDDGNNGLVFKYFDEPVVVGRAWQNPLKNLDANRNTTIEPQDVLVIVNELNTPKFRDAVSGRLLGRPSDTQFYYDANGDGFCSPLDALRIINFLNNSAAEGELTDFLEQPSTGTVIFLRAEELALSPLPENDVRSAMKQTLQPHVDIATQRTRAEVPAFAPEAPVERDLDARCRDAHPMELEDFTDIVAGELWASLRPIN